MTAHIIRGDARHLPLPDTSVDAAVTDPPYELGFVGRAWDSTGVAHDPATWREALRVLKPGGHLVAFGGMRSHHRMMCAIEDAGFELRDAITWLFGSGFPKSHDISSALDRTVPRDARCVCDQRSTQTVQDSPADCPPSRDSDGERPRHASGDAQSSVPSRDGARAHIRDDLLLDDRGVELASICLGADNDLPSSVDYQDPSSCQSAGSRPSGSTRSDTASNTSLDGSRAEHRTEIRTPGRSRSASGLASSLAAQYPNLPRCHDCGRVTVPAGLGTALKPAAEIIVLARRPLAGTVAQTVLAYGTGALNIDACRVSAGQDYRDKCASVVGLDSNRNGDAYGEWTGTRADSAHVAGRWPTNAVFTHLPLLVGGEPIGDACADGCAPSCPVAELDAQSGDRPTGALKPYTERHENASPFQMAREKTYVKAAESGGASRFFPTFRYQAKAPSAERPRLADGTAHPTVKPTALMQWLVRLVTPPGGIVLDPFAGSGTTLEAARAEGMRALGVELDPAFVALATARLTRPAGQRDLRATSAGAAEQPLPKPAAAVDGQLDLLGDVS